MFLVLSLSHTHNVHKDQRDAWEDQQGSFLRSVFQYVWIHVCFTLCRYACVFQYMRACQCVPVYAGTYMRMHMCVHVCAGYTCREQDTQSVFRVSFPFLIGLEVTK